MEIDMGLRVVMLLRVVKGRVVRMWFVVLMGLRIVMRLVIDIGLIEVMGVSSSDGAEMGLLPDRIIASSSSTVMIVDIGGGGGEEGC